MVYHNDSNLESPAEGGEAVDIAAADHTPTHITRAIWVGTAGNVKVTTPDGSVITINNVQDGTLLPVRAVLIWQTGTTASNMVAVW